MPPATVRSVLLPGRHHVLTRFQAEHLRAVVAGGVADTDGVPVVCTEDVAVVWAVTSANHRGTRRNPVPAHRREAAIERFCLAEGLTGVVVGVVDVAPTDRFAELTLKTVAHETGGRWAPDPADTVVACSTASVAAMYRALGYRIVPVEDASLDAPARPWDVLELLVADDPAWRELAHPATVAVFDRYGLAESTRVICSDPVVGSEGGLTATREYRSYIAAFESAAQRKWDQARPYVQPGRIVDIGCATGAMLELAAGEPTLHESDLFGVEVARHLFDECEHRRAQGAFAANPNTFFVQANVLNGPVFPPATVDTTTTFALTHEILSYGGGVSALEELAANVIAHTVPGGVWVNSDVCGPADGDRTVRLRLRTDDGARPAGPVDLLARPAEEVGPYLDGLCTRARLDQFAVDFRRAAGVAFPFEIDGDDVLLRLADAMEFLSKVSYTHNWLSEVHEQFCALDGAAWSALVRAAGFEVDPRSGAWRNDWLVDNVFAPVATLLDPATGEQLDWPDTHVLLVARRPELPGIS
ncbi:hypothetical protein [Modestobacter sp. Leaf380]|uniref:hypothetical protein n=1 Tax=Modestobacter sp. Leaf380 TaxID=1736356 RepID=UPI0006F82073|nr:hypothetical protein [Modestobacter sp. Leaf380]KQS65900.1 methyltransferase [Modestobacter sp. Leaf380]